MCGQHTVVCSQEFNLKLFFRPEGSQREVVKLILKSDGVKLECKQMNSGAFYDVIFM